MKYFLFRFENHSLNNRTLDPIRIHKSQKDNHRNDTLEVDHITANETSDMSVQNYNQKQQIRRLGNFMLVPGVENAKMGNKRLNEKIEMIESDDHSLQLIQYRKIPRLYKQACEYISQIDKKDNQRRRRNKNIRDENETLNITKTLLDLREQQMVEFALETWLLDDELQSEQKNPKFHGIHSFAASKYSEKKVDRFVESNRNHKAKSNANYFYEDLSDPDIELPEIRKQDQQNLPR